MYSEAFHDLKIKISGKGSAFQNKFFLLSKMFDLQDILTKESIFWSIATVASFLNLLKRN